MAGQKQKTLITFAIYPSLSSLAEPIKIMRFYFGYVFLGFWALTFPFISVAGNVSVTFRVDMSKQTVSVNGVHIAGNFQAIAGFGADWDPASTAMADLNGDKVYEITVIIPPGLYEYKYVNDNSWNGAENPPSACTLGENHNRFVNVGNNDLALLPVLFNSCNAELLFSVDMSAESISPEGVHVMGTFQSSAGFPNNWDPATVTLQDLNHDGIYNTRIPVLPGQYEYLYVNGKSAAKAEIPPAQCSIINNEGKVVRTTVTGTENDTLPVYRFGTCDIINPAVSTNYETYWWNDAVFYEIFVRSFYDSNNDGIGDFRGIIEKLDYLNDGDTSTRTDLGVTALWLMPMMKSPSYHGYDVSDYYSTNPAYGTMADFEELVSKAHARGIKVIIDFVMNHTSDQIPWFTQSANSQNGYRDWYIWSPTNPGYTGPWGQNVWNSKNSAYYYAIFYSGMPDLNYRNPAVKTEMFNVTNFWLGKGIDGFRLDAIKYLIEDGVVQQNTPETLDLINQFNTVYKATNPVAFTVGEVWDPTQVIIPYVQEKRLDACFEFTLASSIISAVNSSKPSAVKDQMNTIQQSYPVLQYGTFLTNHDQDRVFTQLGTDMVKMKQASAIYLTLPGIPFIYYGEEVGMIGSGADENKRRPMQWSAGAYAGFSTHVPWMGVGSNYLTNNVATMSQDSGSLLSHYKKLVHIRNEHAPLRKGYFLNVGCSDSNDLAYARIFEDNAVVVISNFGSGVSNPTISLPVSSLHSGTYYIKELYSGITMGTLLINGNGGFENWQPTAVSLAGKETWILSLSPKDPGSVSDITRENIGMVLSPNPAKLQVRVKLNQPLSGNALAEVYSVSGVCVYSSAFTGDQVIIPTASLASGVYFVKISCESKSVISRLAVVK